MYDYPFWAQAIPLVMAFFVWYAIVIRPGRRAEASRFAFVSALVGGERVITVSGLLGKVVAVEGNEYRIEIAPGLVVSVLQDGIRDVFAPVAPAVDVTSADIPAEAASS